MSTQVPYQYPYLSQPTGARFELLAEQLHRLLAGGDPSRDSPYHRAELRLLCEQAWETLEAERIRKNKEIRLNWEERQLKINKELHIDALRERFEMGGTADYYTRPFVLQVLFDKQREIHYSLLPDDYVNLTRYERLPGEGIVDVAPVKRSEQRQLLFVPLEGGQTGLFQGLLRGGLQGNVAYYQEGPRLNYETEPGGHRFTWTELLVRMIIRDDMREELAEAAEFEPTTNLAILSQALQMMRQRTPTEDLSNDGNDAR